VGGAVLGGLTLGAAIAAAALVGAAIAPPASTALAVLAGAAFVAAAIDTKLFGIGPPFLCRQVNQDWLLNYRSWVYGGGFGLQIGAGMTTYVMTAAVPLMIVTGALGAAPLAAVGIGVAFGLSRGLAVLLGARLRNPAALTEFHRRFDARAEPVRQAVIAVQLAVAVIATWIAAPAVVAAAVSLAAVALFARSISRGRARAGARLAV
jgi:hypothetical protein